MTTDKSPPASSRAERAPCCGPAGCGPSAGSARSAPAAPVAPVPIAAPGGVHDVVRERYGAAAKAAMNGSKASCCGSKAPADASGLSFTDPITRDLYAEHETAGLPIEALTASFGCGNPTALAELRPGEVVLDLGAGAGLDLLLAAARVGPTGKAYGLDMTDEMLELAERNVRAAGATNVELLRGQIESIPLRRASVDVILSNCVINLSPDKDAVLREAFRVLRPGGRLAVSDVVLRRELSAEARASLDLWSGCVAGALLESDYVAKLEAAGFVDVSVEPTRVFEGADAATLASSCCDVGEAPSLDGAAMSAFVRARKPS